MSNKRTLEQKRASFAFRSAEEGKNSKKPSEYKSYVKKVPMLIKNNGLGATFAFIKEKGGTYNVIYKHTEEWIFQNELFDLSESNSLREFILACDSNEYRALTKEVLAYFSWLRRFAGGLIND